MRFTNKFSRRTIVNGVSGPAHGKNKNRGIRWNRIKAIVDIN